MSVELPTLTVPTAAKRSSNNNSNKGSRFRYPQTARKVSLSAIPSIAEEFGLDSANSDPTAATDPTTLFDSMSMQLALVHVPQQPTASSDALVAGLEESQEPLLLLPAPPSKSTKGLLSSSHQNDEIHAAAGGLPHSSNSNTKSQHQHLLTAGLSQHNKALEYQPNQANEAILASQLVTLKDAAVITLARRLEYYLVTKCGAARDVNTRLDGFRKAIDELCNVQPGLVNFGHLLKRFMKDLAQKNSEERARHVEEIEQFRVQITHDKDKFFEDKLMALLADKRSLAKKCVQLEKEIDEMRRSRDKDLHDAKIELHEAVQRFEKNFSEHSHMKSLVASIYKSCQAAEERASELEAHLVSLGLQVPGGLSSKASALQEKNAEEANENDSLHMKRKLQEQLPISFVSATRDELELCRLSTQKVLVSCASETQSSFKLLLHQRTAENEQLRLQVNALSSKLKSLEEYIHKKRFQEYEREESANDVSQSFGDESIRLPTPSSRPLQQPGSPAPGGGSPSSVLAPPAGSANNTGSNNGTKNGRMTPRPFLPFDVQPALGIDLKGSTSKIAMELATVGLNLKKQAEEAYQRARKLNAAASWMDEMTMKTVVEGDGPALINTTLESDWDLIPHFLRTTVYPHVANQHWSPTYVSSLLLELMNDYKGLREKARYMRDGKMLAPRVYQQFERRQSPLNRLDASQDEMSASPDNVPFGYVVTIFLRAEMMRIDERRRMAGGASMGGGAGGLPDGWLADNAAAGGVGTLHFRHRKELIAVEMEYAKLAYNFHFASMTYRDKEPLCDMFLKILDGRVPVSLFDLSSTSLTLLHNKMAEQDLARIGTISYKQITSAIFALMSTQRSLVWRGAVYAVVQTLEQKKIPLNGKSHIADLLALENHVEVRGKQGTLLVGASLLVKYIRRAVFQRIEQLYVLIEETLDPLVQDSIAMDGLCVLKMADAVKALEALDAREQQFLASKAKSEDEAALILASRPLTEAVQRMFAALPKLCSSVHLPPPPPPVLPALPQPEGTAGGEQQLLELQTKQPSPSKEGGKSSSTMTRKKSQRQAKKLAATVVVNEDAELVEWYNFCSVLRQTLVVPNEPMFRPWSDISAENDAAKRAAQLRAGAAAAAPSSQLPPLSSSFVGTAPMTAPQPVSS